MTAPIELEGARTFWAASKRKGVEDAREHLVTVLERGLSVMVSCTCDGYIYNKTCWAMTSVLEQVEAEQKGNQVWKTIPEGS